MPTRIAIGSAVRTTTRFRSTSKAAKYQTYHRDGVMRVDGNYGGEVDYEPNSFGGPVEDRTIAEPPLRIDGNAARYDYKNDDEDYYGQPRLFWEKVLDETGRAHLVENIVGSMTNPNMGIADPRPIQERMLKHWYKIHPDFGAAVAKGIGMEPQRIAAE